MMVNVKLPLQTHTIFAEHAPRIGRISPVTNDHQNQHYGLEITMIASFFGGEPSIAIDIAAFLCGVALLYLVMSRTRKKRSGE